MKMIQRMLKKDIWTLDEFSIKIHSKIPQATQASHTHKTSVNDLEEWE